MKGSALFPALGALALATVVADPSLTRAFKGDGSGILPVPGCKKVTSVQIGGETLPSTIRQNFPGDVDGKTMVPAEWPLYELSEAEDGTPVLVRSVQSNDGIWQDGLTITVTGEWDANPEPAAKAGESEAKGGAAK